MWILLLVAVALAVRVYHVWSGDALLAAIRDGDATQVHRLLTMRADPNAKLYTFMDPPDGFFDKLLFRFGVRHHEETEKWRTALMVAASNRNGEIVKDLLDHGADANVSAPGGATALSVCGPKCSTEIVEGLVTHGASATQKDSKGVAPILLAAEGGNPDTIRLLLDHGANVHEVGPSGETPLMLAAVSGNDKAVDVLLAKGAGVNDLKLPLTGRAPAGPAAGARARLAKVSDLPELVGESGSIALLNMVWDKTPESERSALTAKALTRATASAHSAMAAELIRRGGQKTAVATDSNSILAAIDSLDPDLLKLLFDRGGKLPAPQPGDPPVFLRAIRKATTGTLEAGASRVTEVLTMLAKHGADVNSADADGKTAVFSALGSPGLMKTLIDLGANLNVKDHAGLSAVLAPTASSNPQALELLLSHGVSADTKDPKGNTPLMETGWIQNPDAVKILIAHGANVNAANSEGFTPLAAAHRFAWGIKETEEMLTKAGAKETPASLQVAEEMKTRDANRRAAAPLPTTRTSKEDAKKIMPGAGGGGPPRGGR